MSASVLEIHAESNCVHRVHTGDRQATHFDLEKGTGRAKACCGGRNDCQVLADPSKFAMIPVDHDWVVPDGVSL